MKMLLVDDHPIVRLGIRQLIEQAFGDIDIEEADTIADAVTRFGAQPADLVILDLSLPDTTGTEGVARMLRVTKDTPILILSQNTEATYAPRLLQMGVRGYLPKDRAPGELVVAVQRLLGGGRYVTAAMTDSLLGLLDGKTPTRLAHELLSTQEFRVMQLIAAGRSSAQIAETMHLSVKTVSSYRARVMEKGGWKSNAELTKYCVLHGLTDTE